MNFKTYHYHRTENGGPWFTCRECGSSAPPEFKIEKPIRVDIAARCSYIMRGHIVNGKYTSFTGLQKTSWDGIFTGDLLLPVYGKSFVIAEINANNLTLNIAAHFKVFPRSRHKVVEAFLNNKSQAI